MSIVLLLTASMVAGCEVERSDVESVERKSAADTSATVAYTVTGRVMSITPDRDFVMVRHDVIEGFMDAMTMPFEVRDTALVTGISPGDSATFVIEVSRGDLVITSLEKQL